MSQIAPHFFSNMRCDRGQQHGQRLDGKASCRCGTFHVRRLIIYRIGERIELGHRTVEAESLNIRRHRINRLVGSTHQWPCRIICRGRCADRRQGRIRRHAEQASQEPRRTFGTGLGPLHIAFRWRIRHHEQACCIRPIVRNDQLRVDDVAF